MGIEMIKSDTFLGLLGLSLTLFVAVLVGGIISIFPLFYTLVFALVPVYIVACIFFPMVGVFLYCVLSILAPDFKLADVLTLVTLVLFAFKSKLFSGWSDLIPKAHKNLLFLFFIYFSLLLLFSVFYFKNDIAFIYRDARFLLYWLWFPVFMFYVRTYGSKGFTNLVISLGLFVSLIAIVQGFTGYQFVAVGRVGELGGAGDQVGLIRVQMPGFLFVVFLMLFAVWNLFLERKNFLFNIFAVGVSLAAIYLNYGRALWVWSFAAVVVLGFMLGRVYVVRYFSILIFSLCITVGILSLVSPSIVDNAYIRMTSISKEGARHSSYGLRVWENQDAMNKIQESPVWGSGLGSEYRRWMLTVREFPDHTRYIHNSYYFILVKAGVLGLILLFGYLLFPFINFRNYVYASSHNSYKKGVLLSYALIPTVLGLSVTQPELVSPVSVIFCCMLMALVTGKGE